MAAIRSIIVWVQLFCVFVCLICLSVLSVSVFACVVYILCRCLSRRYQNAEKGPIYPVGPGPGPSLHTSQRQQE